MKRKIKMLKFIWDLVRFSPQDSEEFHTIVHSRLRDFLLLLYFCRKSISLSMAHCFKKAKLY